MNINEHTTVGANLADIHAQAVDMASALRTLKPNANHRKNQLFSLLYPVIVELLESNVTQKSILEMLQTKGLKLHPSRFKELMAAEAKLQVHCPEVEFGNNGSLQTEGNYEEIIR